MNTRVVVNSEGCSIYHNLGKGRFFFGTIEHIRQQDSHVPEQYRLYGILGYATI